MKRFTFFLYKKAGKYIFTTFNHLQELGKCLDQKEPEHVILAHEIPQ